MSKGLTPYDLCVSSSVIEHLLAKERSRVRISSYFRYWLLSRLSFAFPHANSNLFGQGVNTL